MKNKKIQKYIASILLYTYSLTSCMQRPTLKMQNQINYKEKLKKEYLLKNITEKINNQKLNLKEQKPSNQIYIKPEKENYEFAFFKNKNGTSQNKILCKNLFNHESHNFSDILTIKYKTDFQYLKMNLFFDKQIKDWNILVKTKQLGKYNYFQSISKIHDYKYIRKIEYKNRKKQYKLLLNPVQEKVLIKSRHIKNKRLLFEYMIMLAALGIICYYKQDIYKSIRLNKNLLLSLFISSAFPFIPYKKAILKNLIHSSLKSTIYITPLIFKKVLIPTLIIIYEYFKGLVTEVFIPILKLLAYLTSLLIKKIIIPTIKLALYITPIIFKKVLIPTLIIIYEYFKGLVTEVFIPILKLLAYLTPLLIKKIIIPTIKLALYKTPKFTLKNLLLPSLKLLLYQLPIFLWQYNTSPSLKLIHYYTPIFYKKIIQPSSKLIFNKAIKPFAYKILPPILIATFSGFALKNIYDHIISPTLEFIIHEIIIPTYKKIPSKAYLIKTSKYLAYKYSITLPNQYIIEPTINFFKQDLPNHFSNYILNPSHNFIFNTTPYLFQNYAINPIYDYILNPGYNFITKTLPNEFYKLANDTIPNKIIKPIYDFMTKDSYERNLVFTIATCLLGLYILYLSKGIIYNFLDNAKDKLIEKKNEIKEYVIKNYFSINYQNEYLTNKIFNKISISERYSIKNSLDSLLEKIGPEKYNNFLKFINNNFDIIPIYQIEHIIEKSKDYPKTIKYLSINTPH